jgi:hypothetical protein
MKRTLMAVVCLFGMAMVSSASAAVINGQFVPDALVGTMVKYRLVFVTSGSIDADSLNLATYQTFVNNQVANTMLAGAIYNWKPVVSTYDGLSTAASAIGTSSVDIYNTAGIVVANGSSDMLDGSLDAPIQYDQNGTSVGVGFVWTGSTPSGNKDMGGSDLSLGSELNGVANSTTLGVANQSTSQWIKAFALPNSITANAGFGNVARIYGISGELTAVPEPSTIALWSVCASVVGLVAWRKRRKSS